MKANHGMTHQQKRILIVALVVGVFLGVFFLAPVIPVLTVGCAAERESAGYYFFKAGYHVLVQPTNGCV